MNQLVSAFSNALHNTNGHGALNELQLICGEQKRSVPSPVARGWVVSRVGTSVHDWLAVSFGDSVSVRVLAHELGPHARTHTRTTTRHHVTARALTRTHGWTEHLHEKKERSVIRVNNHKNHNQVNQRERKEHKGHSVQSYSLLSITMIVPLIWDMTSLFYEAITLNNESLLVFLSSYGV